MYFNIFAYACTSSTSSASGKFHGPLGTPFPSVRGRPTNTLPLNPHLSGPIANEREGFGKTPGTQHETHSEMTRTAESVRTGQPNAPTPAPTDATTDATTDAPKAGPRRLTGAAGARAPTASPPARGMPGHVVSPAGAGPAPWARAAWKPWAAAARHGRAERSAARRVGLSLPPPPPLLSEVLARGASRRLAAVGPSPSAPLSPLPPPRVLAARAEVEAPVAPWGRRPRAGGAASGPPVPGQVPFPVSVRTCRSGRGREGRRAGGPPAPLSSWPKRGEGTVPGAPCASSRPRCLWGSVRGACCSPTYLRACRRQGAPSPRAALAYRFCIPWEGGKELRRCGVRGGTRRGFSCLRFSPAPCRRPDLPLPLRRSNLKLVLTLFIFPAAA